MAEDSSSDFEGITWPDYLVIVAYFLFVLAVGLYVSQADMCDVREGCNIRIHLDRPPRVSRKFGRESRRAVLHTNFSISPRVTPALNQINQQAENNAPVWINPRGHPMPAIGLLGPRTILVHHGANHEQCLHNLTPEAW